MPSLETAPRRPRGIRLRTAIIAVAAVSLLQVLVALALGPPSVERYLCDRCGAMRTVDRAPILAILGCGASAHVDDTACSTLLRDLLHHDCPAHRWFLVDRTEEGGLRLQGPARRAERRVRLLDDHAVARLRVLARASCGGSQEFPVVLSLGPSVKDLVALTLRIDPLRRDDFCWYADEALLERLLADLATREMSPSEFDDRSRHAILYHSGRCYR